MGKLRLNEAEKKFTFIMLSDSNFLSEAKKLNKKFRIIRAFRVQ